MRFVICLILMLCVCTVSADILFQDDFESGKVDNKKWMPQGTWVIEDNGDGHDVLGEKVLAVQSSEIGLSVDAFPEEFDYYADFKTVSAGLTGFVFHAQDANNVYMHQVSTAGSGHTPQHIRWHRKVGGGYTVDAKPFDDKVNRDQNVWYRVKFEVREDYKFKVYLGDVGVEDDELTLVSEWTDAQKSFEKGKIGIRMSGGERAQYDNIVVSSAGFDIFSVEPNRKLTLTWGNLKRK